MISGGCPGCIERLAARSWKRTRRVAFGQSAEMFSPTDGIDFIFARDHYPARRRGSADVVCACEPGAAKIGAGCLAVWGAEDPSVAEHLERLLAAAPGARWILLVTYHETTVNEKVLELAWGSGKDLKLSNFEKRPVISINPSTGPV